MLKKILFMNKCCSLQKKDTKKTIKKNYFFHTTYMFYLIFFFKHFDKVVLLNQIKPKPRNIFGKQLIMQSIFLHKHLKTSIHRCFFNKFSEIFYLNSNQILSNYINRLPNIYKTKQNKTNYTQQLIKVFKQPLKQIPVLSDNQINSRKFKLSPTTAPVYTHVYILFVRFFEHLFQKKIFISFKKINFMVLKFKKNKFITFVVKKLGKNLSFVKYKHFLKDLIKILWITFIFKDSTFFVNWFGRNFSAQPLRNHKKFLRVLKLLLLRYYNFFFKNTGVLGFFFDVRGKLGVSGNAKKRHLSIFSGLYSSTNKSLKINLLQSTVKTSTGLLGVTFCLFF
jgi:hypothetical protein